MRKWDEVDITTFLANVNRMKGIHVETEGNYTRWRAVGTDEIIARRYIYSRGVQYLLRTGAYTKVERHPLQDDTNTG